MDDSQAKDSKANDSMEKYGEAEDEKIYRATIFPVHHHVEYGHVDIRIVLDMNRRKSCGL